MSPSDDFKITTIDAETGKVIPYVLLIHKAYVTKGSGSFMVPNSSYEEGETKFIFTDKNGVAHTQPMPIIGLTGVWLVGSRSHSQRIWHALSSTHELSPTDTYKIKDNDLLLSSDSNHTKVIVMKKINTIKSNQDNISSYLYHSIKQEKAEIYDNQIVLFCRFIESLKLSGNYDIDKMFYKNGSEFWKSPKFYNYLSKCKIQLTNRPT